MIKHNNKKSRSQSYLFVLELSLLMCVLYYSITRTVVLMMAFVLFGTHGFLLLFLCFDARLIATRKDEIFSLSICIFHLIYLLLLFCTDESLTKYYIT